MDDPGQDADAPRRTLAAWLLERRPERTLRATTATDAEPQAAPAAEPEPGPEPTPEPEPEPTPEQPDSARPDDGQPDDGQPASEPPDLHKKPRPRPFGNAPAVYEPSASAASEPQPGDSFFTRPDDADDERWHKDADKDEERAAREDKRTQRRSAVANGLRSLRKIVIIVAVAIVAALLLRNYVVAPYYVPSASMEPTLHGCSGCNNDHVLVEKLSYRFHDVQAGDVIVFNRPDSGRWPIVPDKVLIKRVIGVAGDRLSVHNGRVYRNGQVLAEPYVNQKCRPATIPDVTNPTVKARTFAVVPNGAVFVMGDNRCDSEDSRILGVVPTDKVIGRAFLIVYPFGRFHSLSG